MSREANTGPKNSKEILDIDNRLNGELSDAKQLVIGKWIDFRPHDEQT